MVVPDSSWIYTGIGGRLMLRRDTETILFRPETMASIVTRGGASRKTDIGQQYGSLFLDVETRPDAHTTVHTPFLAAVVKGTRFEVSVGYAGATVSVEDGRVETTDIGRAERVGLRAGQSVRVEVGSTGPASVEGPGPKEPVIGVRSARSVVSLTPAQTREVARSIVEGNRPKGFEMTPSQAAQVMAQEASRSNRAASGAAASAFGERGSAGRMDKRVNGQRDNGNGGSDGGSSASGNGNSGSGNGGGNGNGNNGNGNGNGGNNGGSSASGNGNSGSGNGGGNGKGNNGNGNGNGGNNGGSSASGNGNSGSGNGGGNGKDNGTTETAGTTADRALPATAIPAPATAAGTARGTTETATETAETPVERAIRATASRTARTSDGGVNLPPVS